MEKLVTLQKCVIENITPYIVDVPDSHSSAIKKYINRNKKQNFIAMQNDTLFLANPVNCYILVKLLTWDLNYVEYILERYTAAQIVLLVYIYDVNVREFANGILTGNFRRSTKMFTAVSTSMTSGDCYELALAAYELRVYQIALDWFNEASRKYPEDCHNDCPFTESDISRENGRVKFVLEKDHSVNYVTGRAPIKEKEGSNDLHGGILTQWEYHIRYLCHKEHIYRNRLRCQYRYGPHPFLRLARFKAELLYVEPEIILFHDVISDEEINILKYIAESKISHSNETYEGRLFLDHLTLRHVAYVNDQVSRVAAAVSLRSLDISGLSNTMADSLKVINYGASGYHGHHFDADGSLKTITAQATVLYYLSEPDLGGATTFEKISMSVFPVKKTALYWRTLSPSGEEDLDTLHASCPVLHGSKWVATKWLSQPDALEGVKGIRDFELPKEFAPLSYETLRRLE